MMWNVVMAAIMTPYEGALIVLQAARLAFDYSEAEKNRKERDRKDRNDDRIRELERKIDELSKKRAR